MNGIFLLATLWLVGGVAAGLAVLAETGRTRPVDLRHAVFILAVGFAGVATRGGEFAWAGWAPILLAVWLTGRFVRRSAARGRAARLLGRA